MQLKHAPIAEEALRLPAAVLIGTDLNLYRDARNISYEVGIEHPSGSRRFANIFKNGSNVMLYFRHEMAAVQRLYAAHANLIVPSEIATKYWSKMLSVNEAPKLASTLLQRSYGLMLESCSKKGRKLVEGLAGEENRFLVFHKAAIRLLKRVEVSLDYTVMGTLSSGERPVAEFSLNRLGVCHYRRKSDRSGRWVTLEATDWRKWPAAMAAAVERAK